MNVALFGGTFDPIHRGHLAVAKAAQREYGIKRILFVPSGTPPHKRPLTPFIHRYAMVALATAGEEGLRPSLLESPEQLGDNGMAYSIDTVRRVRAGLKPSDRLFFIIGIDAFLDLAKWRDPVALLRETEFIVASRPGYSLGDIGDALPPALRPPESVRRILRKQAAKGEVVLPGITIHLLPDVSERVSATQIRNAASKGGSHLTKLVGPAVADYIRKTGLYRGAEEAAPEKTRSKVVPMALPKRQQSL
jgi:nicotinate-nucleotide adenylyltransferase